MSEDPRLEAARYRMARIAADDEGADAEAGAASREADAEASTPPAAVPAAPPARNAQERALYVETAIQQAIRRGEFDDLPGAGKPLEGLVDHHDPDWWIRRKIQSEQLTGRRVRRARRCADPRERRARVRRRLQPARDRRAAAVAGRAARRHADA